MIAEEYTPNLRRLDSRQAAGGVAHALRRERRIFPAAQPVLSHGWTGLGHPRHRFEFHRLTAV